MTAPPRPEGLDGNGSDSAVDDGQARGREDAPSKKLVAYSVQADEFGCVRFATNGGPIYVLDPVRIV